MCFAGIFVQARDFRAPRMLWRLWRLWLARATLFDVLVAVVAALRVMPKVLKPLPFSPAGAKSCVDLFNYPVDVVETLCNGPEGARRAAQLHENLSLGWYITEDYAGMGSATMALRQGALAAMERGLIPETLKPFRSWRACDVDPTSLKILGADATYLTNVDDVAEHVFCDLCNRLPTDMKEMLNEMEPSLDASIEERRAHYDAMVIALRENSPSIFRSDAKGVCLRCRGDCLFHPPAQSSWLASCGNTSDAANDVVQEHQRPWHSNHAGHTCVAWSLRGKRDGLAHNSARPFAIWAAERCAIGEDVVFAECVTQFPPEVLVQAIPGRHVLTMYVGPEQLGWPIRRSRVLNALLNPETTVWTGPSDYADDFAKLFHRVCMLQGDALAMADDDERLEYMQPWAQRRGLHLNRAQTRRTRDVDIMKCLTPSAGRRWQRYDSLMREGGHTAFFGEIDQEYDSGHGRTCGPFIPTLMCHGEICNMGENAFLTPKERFVAQGLPVYPELQKSYKALGGVYSVPFAVDMIDNACAIRLAGNGQHQHVMLAWKFYIMSNIKRRASLERLSMVVPTPDAQDNEGVSSNKRPAKRRQITFAR